MLKKTILTAAAALAVIAGGTTISTPDANAGARSNVTFGNSNHTRSRTICHMHNPKKAWVKKPGRFNNLYHSAVINSFRCHKHIRN